MPLLSPSFDTEWKKADYDAIFLKKGGKSFFLLLKRDKTAVEIPPSLNPGEEKEEGEED